MASSHDKRVVLITGASGGLGQALCRAFSNGEYRIGVHVYQNVDRGTKTVQALCGLGIESALFAADLRDSKAVQEMFDGLLMNWGRLDLLIQSAAIRRDRLLAGTASAEWDAVVDVNLKGAFICMREAGQAMRRNGGGQIIHLSSHAALTGRIGQASYTASKRGLIALTQSAAKEWGGDSIQVNAVLPGFLPTPMTAGLEPLEAEKIVEENALGRTSTLEEVSDFILHLSKMKHVSGQIFNLDSRIA